MKNLFLTIAMVFSFSCFAQPTTQKKTEMSAQQKTELRVKQLTLKLDLNASQQKEMSELIAAQQKQRDVLKAQRNANKEKQVKMTSDEKFAMKSKMLDEKIAFKNKLRKFLTPAQLQKWEEMSSREGQKMHMMKEKKHRKSALEVKDK